MSFYKGFTYKPVPVTRMVVTIREWLDVCFKKASVDIDLETMQSDINRQFFIPLNRFLYSSTASSLILLAMGFLSYLQSVVIF